MTTFSTAPAAANKQTALGDNGATNPNSNPATGTATINSTNHNNLTNSTTSLNVAPNVTVDDHPDSINLQHKFNPSSALLCTTTPNVPQNLHPNLYHPGNPSAAANPSVFYPSNHATTSHWAINTSAAPSTGGYQSSALDLHHAFDYPQFGATTGAGNTMSSYHANALQYGSAAAAAESQFLQGYRGDAYGIVTDPAVLGYGVNKAAAVAAAASQYSSGAAHRYPQHSVVPPSYQYPDTQLLHPSFAHVPDNSSTSLHTSNDNRLTPSGTQAMRSSFPAVQVMFADNESPGGTADLAAHGNMYNMHPCPAPFMFNNYAAAAAACYPTDRMGDAGTSPQSYTPTVSSSNSVGGAGANGSNSIRRKNASRETTAALKTWLFEHRKNPYPTKGEKIMLAIITKMSLTQISTWFANARRRLKKENKMTWTPKNKTSNTSHSKSANSQATVTSSITPSAVTPSLASPVKKNPSSLSSTESDLSAAVNPNAAEP